MSIDIKEFIKNPIDNLTKLSNKKLEDFIKIFADNYYNGDNEDLIIDDDLFDKMVETLKKKNPNAKYFNSIGAPIKNDKVKLPFPMFSLNKVKPDTMNIWINSHKGPYSLSDKLDGMSAMLYNHHLYKRGQGLDGQDIGYLLKYINIGKVDFDKIKDVAIRGELIFSKKDFEMINHNNIFKNARNAVSGVVNQKNPNINLCKFIHFVCYNVVYPIMKQEDQYKFLKDNGFNVVYNKQVNNLTVDDLKELTYERKKESDYEIDGIVIVDNPISFNIRKNNLEDVNRNPSYSVAFKFLHQENIINAEVEYIDWNISRYNLLKPRIKIKTVNLMGSDINFITGHNAKFIIDNNIGKGSIIQITKSGEVIPKVINVIKSSKPNLPDYNYKWNDTKVDLIAINDNDDMKKQIFLHEVETNKIKFISEKTIEKLIKLGINNMTELIGEEQLMIDNFGNVMGPKIMNSLKSNLENTSLEQLMSGSGMFNIGLGVKKFKLINSKLNIMDWTKDKLLNINGIGEENANNALNNKDKFINYYNQLKDKCKKFNIKLVDLIDEKYIIKNNNNEDVIIKENKNNEDSNIKENENKIFNKKIVVMTGFRDKNIENFVFTNGGNTRDNVSKLTNILIVKSYDSKYTNSAKYLKAQEWGIKIMSKEEFENEFMI